MGVRVRVGNHCWLKSNSVTQKEMFTDKVMFKALMVLFLVGFLSSDVIVTGKQMRRTATLTEIAIFLFAQMLHIISLKIAQTWSSLR